MTLRLLGPEDREPPMSQMMTFVIRHFRKLPMIWTLFGAMFLCLQIRHLSCALSFKDLGFAIGLPWRAASILACLVSFLLSLAWALASLSCSLL